MLRFIILFVFATILFMFIWYNMLSLSVLSMIEISTHPTHTTSSLYNLSIYFSH